MKRVCLRSCSESLTPLTTADACGAQSKNTASTPIGQTHGRPIGVLAVFFDWAPQASAVVNGVRLSEQDRKHTRFMLLDSSYRVIASSDERGELSETFALRRSPE